MVAPPASSRQIPAILRNWEGGWPDICQFDPGLLPPGAALLAPPPHPIERPRPEASLRPAPSGLTRGDAPGLSAGLPRPVAGQGLAAMDRCVRAGRGGRHGPRADPGPRGQPPCRAPRADLHRGPRRRPHRAAARSDGGAPPGEPHHRPGRAGGPPPGPARPPSRAALNPPPTPPTAKTQVPLQYDKSDEILDPVELQLGRANSQRLHIDESPVAAWVRVSFRRGVAFRGVSSTGACVAGGRRGRLVRGHDRARRARLGQ